MSTALTKPRDTREVVGDLFRGTVAAGETIHAGALAAINATGYIVPASDTEGLRVIGRAEHSAAAGESVLLKRGVFMYGNEDGIADGNVGSYCFAANDQSVKKSGDCPAGLVRGISEDGEVYVDTRMNPDGAAAGLAAVSTTIEGLIEAEFEADGSVAGLIDAAIEGLIEAEFEADGSVPGLIDAALGAIEPALVQLVAVPASATATGAKGDFAVDEDYFYVCTATDTWVRFAIDNDTWT